MFLRRSPGRLSMREGTAMQRFITAATAARATDASAECRQKKQPASRACSCAAVSRTVSVQSAYGPRAVRTQSVVKSVYSQCTVRVQSGCGQRTVRMQLGYAVRVWSVYSQCTVSVQSAHSEHTVSVQSVCGQRTVSVQSGCGQRTVRMRSADSQDA
eukprot:4524938-Pyramimonas_sp.AAC.2